MNNNNGFYKGALTTLKAMTSFSQEVENISLLHANKHKSKEKPKYTLVDLREVSRKYDENFKLLLKSVGKPEHAKYLKIERELNKIDVRIRNNISTDLIKESSYGRHSF